MTEPTPSAAAPSALACAAPNCPNPVAVQWRRRLTQAELDAVTAAEKERWQQAPADPQQPAPNVGPPPATADYTMAVYACGGHSISLDLAAHVHAATCTAPDPSATPSCTCTPEPIPVTPHPAAPATITLPTGWNVPAAT